MIRGVVLKAKQVYQPPNIEILPLLVEWGFTRSDTLPAQELSIAIKSALKHPENLTTMSDLSQRRESSLIQRLGTMASSDIEVCKSCSSPLCVRQSEEETWETMSNASSYVMGDPAASWDKYQQIQEWFASRGIQRGCPQDLSHRKIEGQRQKVLRSTCKLGKAPMLRRFRTCELVKLDHMKVAEPTTPQPDQSIKALLL